MRLRGINAERSGSATGRIAEDSMSKKTSIQKQTSGSLHPVVSHATVETYYAVRIGRPGRSLPYFMVRPDITGGKQTPWLFVSREDAEKECPKQPQTQVVKVRVSHG